MAAGTPADTMRISAKEFQELDLKAHSLLADVPLNDVWMIELAGGPPGRTTVDLRKRLQFENLGRTNAVDVTPSVRASPVHTLLAEIDVRQQVGLVVGGPRLTYNPSKLLSWHAA